MASATISDHEKCPENDIVLSSAEDSGEGMVDENKPAWMRYMPSTPWNSQSIHVQLSSVDQYNISIDSVKADPAKLPVSSNPFAVHHTLLKNKRPVSPEKEHWPGNDDDDSNDDNIRHTRKKSRSSKRPGAGSKHAVDEAAMLFSFCKVEKR